MSKLIILVVVSLLAAAPVYSQELVAGKDGSIRNVEVRALVAGQDGLYLATRRELYKAGDVREKWQPIFALPSGENEISSLAVKAKCVFVGTKRGLFRSQDRGSTWQNVFKTILPGKNNILTVEISKYAPGRIFIGTERGVFVSEDLGQRWRDISDNLQNKGVKSISISKDSVYACADDGLYIRKEGSAGWERIYVQSAPENNTEEGLPDNIEIREDAATSISCIAFKGSRLYIGVGKNILYSDDGGKLWNDFTASGLKGKINHITAARNADSLYSATTKGVFEFTREKGRWLELYKGFDKSLDVAKLVIDSSDEKLLWALTENGLYRLEGGRYPADQYIDVERNMKDFKIIFDGEPGFKELQKAAMRFAEVDPEKIKKWRMEARLRALAPKISVGFDKNRSTNSEIYTSASKDYIFVGPDDVSSGMDVSVSWEIGNLIWSDDQTNIDVRSRLTTQLRNDILDDLRRAYYERKRLQFELLQSPPRDMRARFEKELRLQELTQAVDDLTGNYLSEHMRKGG